MAAEALESDDARLGRHGHGGDCTAGVSWLLWAQAAMIKGLDGWARYRTRLGHAPRFLLIHRLWVVYCLTR
jgi:hypothetical protein